MSQTDRRREWVCKGKDGRPCGAALGFIEGGRLHVYVRDVIAVEAGPDGEVTVTCPLSFHHHRTWKPGRICAA